jgi:hypothetical protein
VSSTWASDDPQLFRCADDPQLIRCADDPRLFRCAFIPVMHRQTLCYAGSNDTGDAPEKCNILANILKKIGNCFNVCLLG